MKADKALDLDFEAGLLGDLAPQTLLEAFAQSEMAAGQIPLPRGVGHGGRSPEDENARAVGYDTVDPEPELLLCHLRVTANFRRVR